ncbi:MAG TPA: multiheme c-type cytochrome [Polyangiaceae bacterium]
MRHAAAFAAALPLLFAGVSACNGCRSGSLPQGASGAASNEPATVRVVAISNLAGALEPCGCTKDQLGGVDHLAAFLGQNRSAAAGSLVVSAGPTMFLDPTKDASRAAQDEWKAEAISASLGEMGLAAWTPGYNDWSFGETSLGSLAKGSGAALLAANLEAGADGATKSAVREVGGVKVGILGVASPELDGAPPTGVKHADPVAAAKAELAELRRGGAKVLVGLASMQRGQALRLAEALPELSLLVVGKPSESGDVNDGPSAPALIGNVLVVEPSNHLQTVAAVDFFVRGDDFHFQDGTGIQNADATTSLDRRMHDLEARIAAWEKDPNIRPEDLAARRADLDNLKEEKSKLAQHPAPQTGSFFRYALVEVRDKQGSDPKVHDRMAAYYRRVNEHNRTAFAGRKPPSVPHGQSGYAGIEVCTTCHEAERKVWDRTAHARAYSTLAKQFKEYNLDCVGCHVTGYEKPGGATVTVNEPLRDVQCESCHGPGQLHASAPDKKGLIVRDPKGELCASACHHPPHVEAFDPEKAKPLILGPGHGLPDDAPWPAGTNGDR